VPLALVMFAASPQIISLFNVPEAARGEASFALKIAAITFVLNFLNGIFNTPQLTRLRMDLNTFVNAGFRILGLIAMPFAVYLWGMVGAVFVLMIASSLTLIGHLQISGRLDPHLFELTIDRPAIRRMLKFGAALVGASIAVVFLVNIEKGILAASVSAAALAHYSVAFTLANMMTLFSTAMIQSLVPAFSQLQSPEKRAQLNALYSRGIRVSFIWLIPSLTFLAIVAKTFFDFWAGAEFAEYSTGPFYILLIGLMFNVTAYLPSTALMAAGRTDIFAKLYWIELALYIVVVWLLASGFGAVGAAAAWSLRVGLDALVQFYLAKRLAGVSYVRRDLYGFVPGLLIMLLPVAAGYYFDSFKLALIAAFFCLAVYAVVIFKAVLKDEEISWLHDRFSIGLARIRS